MHGANGNLDFFWVEKYRPQSFEEILGQPVVKIQLRRIVDTKNLPNLLLFGPPGTGKSSAAEVVARELFGDVWEGNFTEINASDIFEQGRKDPRSVTQLGTFLRRAQGCARQFQADHEPACRNRSASCAVPNSVYKRCRILDAGRSAGSAKNNRTVQSDLQVHPGYRAPVANYYTH